METYILASEKKWNKNLLGELQAYFPGTKWLLIEKKADLNFDFISAQNPAKIFFPHWSYIIPEKIFSNFECIVFHMTDLPYGRGGSPLQNLIVNGHKETKLSALKVDAGIDTGDIYLKKKLGLQGSAAQIFTRGNAIVLKMIREIIEKKIKPVPQKGEPTYYKRRTPEMSDISALAEVEKVYDYIRMLDAEGYPKAFIDTGSVRFEFSNAKLVNDNEITAHVRITTK